MSTQPIILLIEDDASLRAIIEAEFSMAGFSVEATGNGRDGLARAQAATFDLIILDLNLPGMDGLEICKALRAKDDDVPILMLTARKDDIDRVLGLELGADDYLGKPFVMRELLARIKAILKRSANQSNLTTASAPALLRFGELVVNLNMREISLKGEKLRFSKMEFELISFLAQNAGRAFTREDIMEMVWGYAAVGYEQNVTTHIARIRSKLEPTTETPIYLKTVKGFGYAFATPEEFDS